MIPALPTIIIILGILYLLGFIILSALTLLPIKSIFDKNFSFSQSLKKAVNAFIKKPNLAKILLILAVFHAIGMFFFGSADFLGDILDELDQASSELQNVMLALTAGAGIVGGVFAMIAYPLNVLGQGFLILAYQEYVKNNNLDPGAWKKLISLKGLYLIIASLIVAVIALTGTVFFLFPGLILAWSMFYTPYLIILEDDNPITAIIGSFEMFTENPWDTIFLHTFFTISSLILLTPGLESAFHFLLVLPIITFTVTDYLIGSGRK